MHINLVSTIYKDYELVATTNEQGLLEVTDKYREELEGLIPAQYLELKEIEPKELEEKSKEEDKSDSKKEEEKEEQKETVSKMQEDTGLELVSLVRIEDENFSREVRRQVMQNNIWELPKMAQFVY